MKIGSPKNLEGKNLLVGVSAVNGEGNFIGSDITTLKKGANVTFTSSANGVLVIDAASVASVENATSAVYATNDKNGNDITTAYQTVIGNNNKISGAYISGAVASATNATTVNGLTVSTAVPANAQFTDTIPGSAVITISAGGTSVGSFTANESSNKSVNIPAATSNSYGVVKVEQVVSNTTNAVANKVVSAVSSTMNAHIESTALHVPAFNTSNNGQVLKISGGVAKWDTDLTADGSAVLPNYNSANAGQVLKVNAAGTGTEWSNAAGGGLAEIDNATDADAFITTENNGKAFIFTGETDEDYSKGHIYQVVEDSGAAGIIGSQPIVRDNNAPGTYTLVDQTATGTNRVWKNEHNYYIMYVSGTGWCLQTQNNNSSSYRLWYTNTTEPINSSWSTWVGVGNFATELAAAVYMVNDITPAGAAGGGDIITCTATSEASAALTEENDGKLIYYTGTTDSTWTNGHLYLVQATAESTNTKCTVTMGDNSSPDVSGIYTSTGSYTWTNGTYYIYRDSGYVCLGPNTNYSNRLFRASTLPANDEPWNAGTWSAYTSNSASGSITVTQGATLCVATDLMAGGSSGSGLPEISTISDAEAFCVAANEGKAFLYTGETTAATESRHYLELSVSGSMSSSYTQYAGNYYLYSGNADDTSGIWKREDEDYAIKFISATGWFVFSSPTGSQVFQISSSASNPTTAFATASSYGFGANRTATTQYHLGNGTMGATLGHIYLVVEGTEAGTIGTYLAQDITPAGGGDMLVASTTSEIASLATTENAGKVVIYTGATSSQSSPARVTVAGYTNTACNGDYYATGEYSKYYGTDDTNYPIFQNPNTGNYFVTVDSDWYCIFSALDNDGIWSNDGDTNTEVTDSGLGWYDYGWIKPSSFTEGASFTQHGNMGARSVTYYEAGVGATYTQGHYYIINGANSVTDITPAGGSGGVSDIIVCTTSTDMAAACIIDNIGKVCLYTGETNSSYTKGHHYEIVPGESALTAESTNTNAAGTYAKNGNSHTYNGVAYPDYVNGQGTVLYHGEGGPYYYLQATSSWGGSQGNTISQSTPSITSLDDWPSALDTGSAISFRVEMGTAVSITFHYSEVGVAFADLDNNGSGSTPANELPAYSASDANKVLQVNSTGTGVAWTSVVNSATNAVSATSAVSAGALTSPITINGVALNGGTSKTLANLSIASATHSHTTTNISNFSTTVSTLASNVVSSYVKNATITFTQGGVTKGSFTLNQATNSTIALDAGGAGGGSVTLDSAITSDGVNAVVGSAIYSGIAAKADIADLAHVAFTGDYNDLSNKPSGGGGGSVTVDSELSSTSENPVQNKVIWSAIGNIESILASL